ncbi:MAG: DedA family protein [Pirellulales bacterium]
MDAFYALLHDYGYVGITLFLILTGCGLPLPEEVALIFAGIAASQGEMNPWFAMLACLIGCLVGDSIMYWIGSRVGRRVMNSRTPWGRYSTPEREKLLEHLIHQHGVKVLFVARFLVGVRSPVYLTAGILKFPFRRFILADLFCAAVVILLFFGVSYYFGKDVVDWIRNAEYGLTIVIVAGVLIGGIFAWRHYRRNKDSTQPGALEKLLGENRESLEDAQDEPKLGKTVAKTE